jgi:hypothetical protein
VSQSVALYRGCTVSEAELVAVCAQPRLVRRFVEDLLGKPQSEQLAERTRVAGNPWRVRRRASPPFVRARTQRPSKLATPVFEHGCSSSTVTQNLVGGIRAMAAFGRPSCTATSLCAKNQ